jgi:dTDP-4-amino-4,6-dideoxygalactose transaminase
MLEPPKYPNLNSKEISTVLSYLYDERQSDRYYFNGPTAFENELCDFLGTSYCFATNSGHVSILIALLAAEVHEGDEVITTPISWGQTLSPVLTLGATPVFADIDPDTFQISYENIVSKYTSKTKAVLVVNLYGSSPELLKIRSFCDEKGIILIEDAAQSMGCRYGNSFTGTVGHIGAFSFNSTKLLPIGGAGAVITDDKALFDKIIQYGSKSTHKKKVLGADNPLCDGLDATYLCHPILQEVGRIKLQQLEEMNYYRSENMKFIRKELEDVKGIHLQGLHPGSSESLYMFSFKNLLPIKIDKLTQLFKHYKLPMFRYNPIPLCEIDSGSRWSNKFTPTVCPNARELSNNEICITSYKWYTKDQDYLRSYSDIIHQCYDMLEKRL